MSWGKLLEAKIRNASIISSELTSRTYSSASYAVTWFWKILKDGNRLTQTQSLILKLFILKEKHKMSILYHINKINLILYIHQLLKKYKKIDLD